MKYDDAITSRTLDIYVVMYNKSLIRLFLFDFLVLLYANSTFTCLHMPLETLSILSILFPSILLCNSKDMHVQKSL